MSSRDIHGRMALRAASICYQTRGCVCLVMCSYVSLWQHRVLGWEWDFTHHYRVNRLEWFHLQEWSLSPPRYLHVSVSVCVNWQCYTIEDVRSEKQQTTEDLHWQREDILRSSRCGPQIYTNYSGVIVLSLGPRFVIFDLCTCCTWRVCVWGCLPVLKPVLWFSIQNKKFPVRWILSKYKVMLVYVNIIIILQCSRRQLILC